MQTHTTSQLYIKTLLALLLMVVISSCSGDTGSVTGTEKPDQQEAPAEVTSKFETEDTLLLPEEIQTIIIEGSTLENGTVNAVLGNGTEISLYHADDAE